MKDYFLMTDIRHGSKKFFFKEHRDNKNFWNSIENLTVEPFVRCDC